MQEQLDVESIKVTENLSDEDIYELLERKWIDPIIEGIDSLVNNTIEQFIKSIKNIESKYEYTMKKISNDIKETENKLCEMIDELIGNNFDKEGLEDFKSLIGGE